MGDAHSTPTTPGDSFNHDRIANSSGCSQRFLLAVDVPVGPGWCGYASLLGQCTADRLVLQCVHGTRAGTDEADVATFADICEMGVLRKKPISGMNCVHIRDLGRTNNTVYPKVTL